MASPALVDLRNIYLPHDVVDAFTQAVQMETGPSRHCRLRFEIALISLFGA